jgi:hypothetical protein
MKVITDKQLLEMCHERFPHLFERNFCQRCGKRLGLVSSIHTCTPPRTFDDYGNKIL